MQVAMGKAIDNAEWVADANVPDPEHLPHLPSYHVLVRPVSVRKQTKGGIHLPDKYVDDVAYLTTVGRVLKLGDLAYQDESKFPKGAWCEVGDFVTYGKHSGQKMMYQGVQMLLLYDDQVLLKVDSPEDLDTSFNLVSY